MKKTHVPLADLPLKGFWNIASRKEALERIDWLYARIERTSDPKQCEALEDRIRRIRRAWGLQ